MRIVLDGPPTPKLRHRTDFRRRIHYDPQAKEKKRVKNLLMAAISDALDSENKWDVLEASKVFYSDVFDVRMCFHITPPVSWSQARRNEALWGCLPCDTKPDLDNLEKFMLDCCNGTLFDDDKSVIKLSSQKLWASKPKTILEIMPKSPISINDKLKGILVFYGPEKLMHFMELALELLKLYNVSETKDWVADAVGEDNQRDVRLARTAILLSEIAESHGKELYKITRKFPKASSEAMRVAEKINALNNGEVDRVLEEKKEDRGAIYKISSGQANRVTDHSAVRIECEESGADIDTDAVLSMQCTTQ